MSAALESSSRLRNWQPPIGSVSRELDQHPWVIVVKGQIMKPPQFNWIKLPNGSEIVDPASPGFKADPHGPARRLQRYREAYMQPQQPERTERPWEKLVFIQKAESVDSKTKSGVQSSVVSVEEASPTSELNE